MKKFYSLLLNIFEEAERKGWITEEGKNKISMKTLGEIEEKVLEPWMKNYLYHLFKGCE